jgi:hypothetical protein
MTHSDLRNRLSPEYVETEVFIKFNLKSQTSKEKLPVYYEIPFEEKKGILREMI